MKLKYTVPIMIVLFLFTILPMLRSEELHVGLGVSNMNLVATLNGNQTEKLEIGRVFNTGDFNMTISGTWIPNGDGSSLSINVIPNEMFLQPNEAETVFVEATGFELGNYSGIVDFSCDVHTPPNYVGNPTVPGGRMNVKFEVGEEVYVQEEIEEDIIEMSLWETLLPICAQAISVTGVVGVTAFIIIIVKKKIEDKKGNDIL